MKGELKRRWKYKCRDNAECGNLSPPVACNKRLHVKIYLRNEDCDKAKSIAKSAYQYYESCAKCSYPMIFGSILNTVGNQILVCHE
jgi:hypothetical protein